MEDSIFLPFLNSQGVSPSLEHLLDSPQGYEDSMNLSITSLDGNLVSGEWSRAKQLSPQSSTKSLPITGHADRSNMSLSAAQHAISKHTSSPPSETSGVCSLTGDSDPQSSSTVEGPIMHPTTPPANEPYLRMPQGGYGRITSGIR
jgi:hypothetical protein